MDDIFASLSIHTMSYLMDDKGAAPQIRDMAEKHLATSVQNLSKAHDDAQRKQSR